MADLFDVVVARKLSDGGGGGGGSSDFSTAQVTVVNNLQSSENLNMPCIISEGGMNVIYPITPINDGTNTITVPLYKDGLIIIPLGAFERLTAFSGDVSVTGEVLLVFGNCSLTLG